MLHDRLSSDLLAIVDEINATKRTAAMLEIVSEALQDARDGLESFDSVYTLLEVFETRLDNKLEHIRTLALAMMKQHRKLATEESDNQLDIV